MSQHVHLNMQRIKHFTCSVQEEFTSFHSAVNILICMCLLHNIFEIQVFYKLIKLFCLMVNENLGTGHCQFSVSRLSSTVLAILLLVSLYQFFFAENPTKKIESTIFCICKIKTCIFGINRISVTCVLLSNRGCSIFVDKKTKVSAK